MLQHRPRRLISGGQTGVDRAGLDVAIHLEVEHGGWCPAGRRAEDGRIPRCYQLRETAERDYAVRTERNVLAADGTLILYQPPLGGGTALTYRLAQQHRRPCLLVDISSEFPQPEAVAQVRRWLGQQPLDVLNIAGPRESSFPGIQQRAERFLLACLGENPASLAD